MTHVKLRKNTLQHTCNFHPSMRGWFRDALTFPQIPLLWISLFLAPTSHNMWGNFLGSSKCPPFDVLHLFCIRIESIRCISWKYKCIRLASLFNDFTKSFVRFELKLVGFLYMYIATMDKQKNHLNCSVTYILLIFFLSNWTSCVKLTLGWSLVLLL